jgi:hypothetical protein
MKPQLRAITPAEASELLKRNVSNRKMRKSWVEYLASQIRRGVWVTNSDAIALSADGILLNGQHRLSAIVAADMPAKVLFVEGMDPDAFKIIDRGVGRTQADVTGLPGALVADINLIGNFLNLRVGNRMPEDVIEDVAAWWRPAYDALIDAHSSFSAGVSSASVRVGFGLRWATSGPRTGNREYALTQYKALMTNDVSTMSRAVGTLWKRLTRNKVGGGSTARMAAASMVFHGTSVYRSSVEPLVRYQEEVHDEVRQWLGMMETAYLVAPTGGHPYLFSSKPSIERALHGAAASKAAARQAEAAL